MLKLTRAVLADVRARSLRKRIWFRSLNSMERSLMNLTIRVVDEVKSSRLDSLLCGIVHRLEEALENKFMTKVVEIGGILAERYARLAYSWGFAGALEWTRDKEYILYLGVSHINSLRMFGSVS